MNAARRRRERRRRGGRKGGFLASGGAFLIMLKRLLSPPPLFPFLLPLKGRSWNMREGTRGYGSIAIDSFPQPPFFIQLSGAGYPWL